MSRQIALISFTLLTVGVSIVAFGSNAPIQTLVPIKDARLASPGNNFSAYRPIKVALLSEIAANSTASAADAIRPRVSWSYFAEQNLRRRAGSASDGNPSPPNA